MLAILAISAIASGCARSTSASTSTTSPAKPEAKTAKELLAVARKFNDQYAANDVGPVYDRWDAASKKVISKAQYVLRHHQCPSNPGVTNTQSALPASGGWWIVHYSISGIQLTDYWRYFKGRWQFDLIRSNPSAVKLYELPISQYVKAVGCAR